MPDADDNGIVNKEIIYTKIHQIKIEECLKPTIINKIEKNIYVTKCFINSEKNKNYIFIYVLSNDFLGFCFNDNLT